MDSLSKMGFPRGTSADGAYAGRQFWPSARRKFCAAALAVSVYVRMEPANRGEQLYSVRQSVKKCRKQYAFSLDNSTRKRLLCHLEPELERYFDRRSSLVAAER